MQPNQQVLQEREMIISTFQKSSVIFQFPKYRNSFMKCANLFLQPCAAMTRTTVQASKLFKFVCLMGIEKITGALYMRNGDLYFEICHIDVLWSKVFGTL